LGGYNITHLLQLTTVIASVTETRM